MEPFHSLCGLYHGQKRIREGRQDELSPTERKELERNRGKIELKLHSNGTFESEITRGTWSAHGDRVCCAPTTFGGQSCEEMRLRAEEMGRSFALAFLFRPFELRVLGESLVTVDDQALVYTEYQLASLQREPAKR